jgi:hypothetical protein
MDKVKIKLELAKKQSLDKLKKQFDPKDKETFAVAIFICVFMSILLILLLVQSFTYKRQMRESALKMSTSSSMYTTSATFMTVGELKQLLKSLVVIVVYAVTIYYIIKKLKPMDVALLLPCLLIITLPFILRYVFEIYSMPMEDPIVSFIFLIVTFNLWYTFSSNIDEEIFSEDSKALNINMSVVLIFMYILFKHYYKLSTSDALLRAIALTGASGVFMVTAPMYAYIPKSR